MQVPGPFEYERATSVDHAIGLLDRLGEGALIVAGGHSLLPMMKLRIANPEYLVDINDLAAELGYIVVDPTRVRIGAMTRHREVLESDDLAACARSSATPNGSSPTRSCATAAPSAARCARPTPPRTSPRSAPCSARSAWPAARPGSARSPIDDFLTGPVRDVAGAQRDADRDPDSVAANSSSAYAKVERRVGDWAVAAAGAAVTLDGDVIVAARIGLTAVNADAAGWPRWLTGWPGKPASEEVFAQAGRRARRPAPGHRHARAARTTSATSPTS